LSIYQSKKAKKKIYRRKIGKLEKKYWNRKGSVKEGCQIYHDEQIKILNIEKQKFCDAIQINVTLTELCYFIWTEKDLSMTCGIESFLLLDTVVEILNEIYPNSCLAYDYHTKVINFC